MYTIGMTLNSVVSGGQTGAEQGAIAAAQALGIRTRGTAPRGWLTDGGEAPWLADCGLRESLADDEPARIRANVRDARCTVWFGDTSSPQFAGTHLEAEKLGRPFMTVVAGVTRPSDLAIWLRWVSAESVNVTGERENRSPGIGARVERFLRSALAKSG